MAVLIKIRRDSYGNWAAYNPVLALGEPAYITDLNQFCIGDGVTPFSGLPKFKTLEQIDLSQYALTADMLTAIQGASDVLQGQVTAHQTSIDAISDQQLADNAHLTNIDNQLTQNNSLVNTHQSSIEYMNGVINQHTADIDFITQTNNARDVTLSQLVAYDQSNDIALAAVVADVAALQAFSIGEIDGGGAAG